MLFQYEFLIGSNLTLQATDRLNEKRAWFGSEAFRLVDRFFQEKDYVNNPSKISQYAQWATRGDGPALYSTPTPMACTVSDSDPKYIVSRSSTTFSANGLGHSPTCRNLMVYSNQNLWSKS